MAAGAAASAMVTGVMARSKGEALGPVDDGTALVGDAGPRLGKRLPPAPLMAASEAARRVC